MSELRSLLERVRRPGRNDTREKLNGDLSSYGDALMQEEQDLQSTLEEARRKEAEFETLAADLKRLEGELKKNNVQAIERRLKEIPREKRELTSALNDVRRYYDEEARKTDEQISQLNK